MLPSEASSDKPSRRASALGACCIVAGVLMLGGLGVIQSTLAAAPEAAARFL